MGSREHFPIPQQQLTQELCGPLLRKWGAEQTEDDLQQQLGQMLPLGVRVEVGPIAKQDGLEAVDDGSGVAILVEVLFECFAKQLAGSVVSGDCFEEHEEALGDLGGNGGSGDICPECVRVDGQALRIHGASLTNGFLIAPARAQCLAKVGLHLPAGLQVAV